MRHLGPVFTCLIAILSDGLYGETTRLYGIRVPLVVLALRQMFQEVVRVTCLLHGHVI